MGGRRDLPRRLEEGRQDFQPALWARLLGLGTSTRTSLIWVILLSLLAGLAGGVPLSQLHRHRQRGG